MSVGVSTPGGGNPDRLVITRDELADLIATQVQRILEKRPVEKPLRGVSPPAGRPPRPPARIPREGQGERISRNDEVESRSAPVPGQKRTHVELSEQVEELQRELRQLLEVRRNIGLVPRRMRDGPFADNILMDELPASYRPMTFEYDGTSDPWDHICRFENTALLHRYYDGVKCWVFPTTLTKSAQTWFSQIGEGILHSFEQLTALFLHHFASSRKQAKSTQTLFGIKQNENEPLRAFVKTFTTATLESDPPTLLTI